MIALTIAPTATDITMPPTVCIRAPTAIVARLPPGTALAASETIALEAMTPEQTEVVTPVLTAIVVAARVMLLMEYGAISLSVERVWPSISLALADSSAEPVTSSEIALPSLST